jgi:hypothetical protein
VFRASRPDAAGTRPYAEKRRVFVGRPVTRSCADGPETGCDEMICRVDATETKNGCANADDGFATA